MSQSSDDLRTNLLNGRTKSQAEDLWIKALNSLNADDLQELVPSNQQNLDKGEKRKILIHLLDKVEQKKQEWKVNRWRYERNGRNVVIIDVWSKITTWITSVIAIIDVAVQYDPAHAALPWAGIRLVLQVAVNDSQTQGAVAEGLEVVSLLLVRYELVEQIYIPKASKSKALLVNAISKLYVSILEYLAKAAGYYSQSIAKRLVKSVAEGGIKVREVLSKISKAEKDVESIRSDIDSEFQEIACDKLNAFSIQLQSLWDNLEKPIVRMANQILMINSCEISEREAEKRRKTLSWLSRVSYRDHYEDVKGGILVNTGQWLLKKPEFVEWRRSSVSSILWLRGIPGSGKSMATTLVLESLLEERSRHPFAAPVAFFYCARNPAEPERSEPSEIFRAILKQLCSSSNAESIREPIPSEYEQRMENRGGDSLRPLDEKDSLRLILLLTAENPATIVIDALDECDPKKRYKLLSGLRRIVHESVNLVKVFISSRDNRDIISQLDGVPSIFINVSDNREDIKRFVELEVSLAVDEKRLLCGKVPTPLKNRIINVLRDGAQGMFRWASLSIQSLCDSDRIKLPGDVELALGRLPKDLSGLYDIIYAQFPAPSEYSKSAPGKTLNSNIVARRTLNWILSAQVRLSTEQFIAAVCGDFYGQPSFTTLTSEEILDVCCNLVVHDTWADTFRFAHLSVREYLENRPEYSEVVQQAAAINQCLEFFTFTSSSEVLASKRKNPFSRYAVYHLGTHLRDFERFQRDQSQCTTMRVKIREFLFQDGLVGPPFANWTDMVRAGPLSLRGNWKDMMKIVSKPPSPLFFACNFGLLSVVEDLTTIKGVLWNQRNKSGESALHHAVRGGYSAICEILLDQGVNVSIQRHWSINGNSDTAPMMAARYGHANCLEILLKRGAEMNKTLIKSAMCVAASSGQGKIIEMLIAYGADINSTGVLQAAAANDSRQIVNLLLELGVDINMGDDHGYFALERAAAAGHERLVEILLEKGAKISPEGEPRYLPIHSAASGGHFKTVEILIRHGADVNSKDKDGSTPLQALAKRSQGMIRREDYEITSKILLKNGADVNSGDPEELGISFVLIAGHKRIAEILLELEEDTEARAACRIDSWPLGLSLTVLGRAAEQGHQKYVETLIEHAAAVEREDISALYRSDKDGHDTVVIISLKHGTDFNSRGHQTIVEILLQHEMEVDANPELTWSALQATV